MSLKFVVVYDALQLPCASVVAVFSCGGEVCPVELGTGGGVKCTATVAPASGACVLVTLSVPFTVICVPLKLKFSGVLQVVVSVVAAGGGGGGGVPPSTGVG